MAERIPQSIAKRVLLKAYLSSDHISAATGKTIAVVISKNAGAFGNPSAGATNATEIANGWYYVDLSTTDTGTAGPLVVRGTAGTIDDVEDRFVVADAHNAGFDGVPSAAAEAAGGLYTRGTGAGQINQSANGQIDCKAVAVVGFWKKNTAKSNFPFLLKGTDGLPRTGLTVTATRRIDSGSFASCSNSVTEVSNGWYTLDISAADLNGDTIGFRFVATGIADHGFTVVTQT